MAHGKKRGGGGAKDKHATQATGAPNHRGKGKRRRQTGGNDTTSANAPSAAFLAALEAQRANQTGSARSVTHTDADVNAMLADVEVSIHRPKTSARAALPGFYYDEAKGRYFKLTKQHQQLQQQKQRAQASAREASKRKQQHLTAKTVPCTRRRGWVGFLAAREFLAAGAVHHRDHRELMPRFYASRFTRQVLSRVEIGLNATRDRFSAMDISPDALSMFMGYASGHMRSFALPNVPGDSPIERESVRYLRWTISCIRHHGQSPNVLVSAVGGQAQEELAPLLRRGEGRLGSGRVCVVRPDLMVHGSSVWPLNDPWVVEWCPQDTNVFSAGLSGQQGAALVDCSASWSGHGVTMAPPGRIQSDTLSQTFSPQSSSVVVNGARNGSWWIWDSRAPRRAIEVVNSTGQSAGSLQCLRLLRDERRMVTQRSNGELAVIDLRSPSHSPVIHFCTGERDAYRSMLRFDVDENETVVAAATSPSLTMFDLSRGVELSQLRVSDNEMRTEEVSRHSVEQVIFRETYREPTLWGLGRSALYRSSSKGS